MNINLKLKAEEEMMVSTLLQMKPKFRKKPELALVEALRIYYQNQERVKFRG